MTAWGEPADGTWTNGPGYTGHQMDAGSKLVYMQQRYYDPRTAMFISSDPIGARASTGANFNRYGYAGRNSYANIDPDGRYSCDKERSEENCRKVAAGIKKLEQARKSTRNLRVRSALGGVLNFLGTEGDGNGVEIAETSGNVSGGWESWNDSGKKGGRLTINFSSLGDFSRGNEQVEGFMIAATIAHEGLHGLRDWVDHTKGVRNIHSRGWIRWGEIMSGVLEARVAEALGYDHPEGHWTNSGGLNTGVIKDRAERSTKRYCAELARGHYIACEQ